MVGFYDNRAYPRHGKPNHTQGDKTNHTHGTAHYVFLFYFLDLDDPQVAFKASSTTGIRSIRQSLVLKQGQCMQLLQDMEKAEALQQQ